MATIYCFTSTGNSLYAAKKIAAKIDGKVMSMKGGSAVTCTDDVIGFVFPIYFWGLPRLVERFISQIHIENKAAYVFAVATFGGVGPGVPGIVKKLLEPKGVPLNYGARLKMADNYIPMYKPKDSEELRKKIDENLAEIADAVSRKENSRIQACTFLNKLVYKSYPDERSDQFFTVSPDCTGCATCQKVCPANNISMDAGKPGFLHNCENCFACLQCCPVSAIEWKDKTKGKQRFRNAGITLDELISLNEN